MWPAKVHRTVQLDEIYDVFPYFVGGTFLAHKHFPINGTPRYAFLTAYASVHLPPDTRFPNLRHIIQTSKQDLDGMYRIPDFLTYDAPEMIRGTNARTPSP